LANIQ
jgi:hypothetical protein